MYKNSWNISIQMCVADSQTESTTASHIRCRIQLGRADAQLAETVFFFGLFFLQVLLIFCHHRVSSVLFSLCGVLLN